MAQWSTEIEGNERWKWYILENKNFFYVLQTITRVMSHFSLELFCKHQHAVTKHEKT